MDFDADVVIVGGGPAGLSAALILGRACRTVIVFDDGRPRNAATHALHGLLSRDGISPAELLRFAREDLKKYPCVRLETAKVKSAATSTRGFTVTLDDGRTVRSRKLLISTGVAENIPDIPGLHDFYGRSIFHCPFCDAWDFRDQTIAVHGRGRRGHGLAMEMLSWTKDLVLCTDGDPELNETQQAQLARNGIRVRTERIMCLEGSDGKLERVRFETGEPVACRALFFSAGQHQKSPLAVMLGAELNRKGTVETGHNETTAVPGLCVAGDASRDVQWVVVAAAEGAEAAYAITQELIREDWK
jgi:thioredoxin reductase